VIRSKKSFLDSSLSIGSPTLTPVESIIRCKSNLPLESQFLYETLQLIRNDNISGAIQSMNLSCFPPPIPQSLLEDSCAICYDSNSEYRLSTPCCSKAFCASCMLKWLSKNSSCPLCRSTFHPNSLLLLNSNPLTPTSSIPSLPTKFEALDSLIENTPDGKFLIYSRYENSLTTLNDSCITLPLTGSSFAIQKTIERFKKGYVRALYLDSKVAAAGLHLHMATHFVFMHKLMPDEYSFLIGRALAPGRTSPLQIVHLFSKNES
jgi:hypothetical protein